MGRRENVRDVLGTLREILLDEVSEQHAARSASGTKACGADARDSSCCASQRARRSKSHFEGQKLTRVRRRSLKISGVGWAHAHEHRVEGHSRAVGSGGRRRAGTPFRSRAADQDARAGRKIESGICGLAGAPGGGRRARAAPHAGVRQPVHVLHLRFCAFRKTRRCGEPARPSW